MKPIQIYVTQLDGTQKPVKRWYHKGPDGRVREVKILDEKPDENRSCVYAATRPWRVPGHRGWRYTELMWVPDSELYFSTDEKNETASVAPEAAPTNERI